jgi:hypothetical protein
VAWPIVGDRPAAQQVFQRRGDWTPLELFLAGVRGWKACLQQLIGRLADGK